VIKSISLDLRREALHPDFIDSGEFPVQGLLMTLRAPHLEIYGVEIGRLRLLGVQVFRHALPSSYAKRTGDGTVPAEGTANPDPDGGAFDTNLAKLITAPAPASRDRSGTTRREELGDLGRSADKESCVGMIESNQVTGEEALPADNAFVFGRRIRVILGD
jgi:hypothetical protein